MLNKQKRQIIILAFLCGCDSRVIVDKTDGGLEQSQQVLSQDQAGILVNTEGTDSQGSDTINIDIPENNVVESPELVPVALTKYIDSQIECEQLQGNAPVNGISSGEAYCRIIDENQQRLIPNDDGITASWSFTADFNLATLELAASELGDYDIKLTATADFPAKAWYGLDIAIINVKLDENDQSMNLSQQSKNLLGEDCNNDSTDGIDLSIPNNLVGIFMNGDDVGGNGKGFLIFDNSTLRDNGTNNLFFGRFNSRVEDQGTGSTGVFLANSNYISNGLNNTTFLHPLANAVNANGSNFKFITPINFCP